MNMITKKTVLTLIIFLVFFVVLSCSSENEKDRLIKRFNDLVGVFEEKNINNIKDYLADDFLVSEKMNNQKFFIYLQYQFRRNKNISVTVLSKDIRMQQDLNSADIIIDALLLGSGDWLPERGQAYTAESRWVKQEGDWVMSRLRWRKKE